MFWVESNSPPKMRARGGVARRTRRKVSPGAGRDDARVRTITYSPAEMENVKVESASGARQMQFEAKNGKRGSTFGDEGRGHLPPMRAVAMLEQV